MQYIQFLPVLLCVAYVLFVWLKVIRPESRQPAPDLHERIQREEGMYFEEASGTRDPAGLWREMSPRQKRTIQRGLVVVLAVVAASHFFWFIPMDAPDWVWDRAETMDLPDSFIVESAVSYASPLQWRVIYTGRMDSGAHAEAVYTHHGLRGTDEMVFSGGPVGGPKVRLYFGVVLVLVAIAGVWSTLLQPGSS